MGSPVFSGEKGRGGGAGARAGKKRRKQLGLGLHRSWKEQRLVRGGSKLRCRGLE